MGKSRSTTVRRTVSLPEDIDRRMEKYADINWSEVARLAFEKKLAEMVPKTKEQKIMEATIERLRSLALKEANAAEQTGAELGTKWACETAEPKELRRLEYLANSRDFEHFLESNEQDTYSLSQRVVELILGKENFKRNDADEFWEFLLGDMVDETRAMIEDSHFAQAFIEAAVDVWDKVKNEI